MNSSMENPTQVKEKPQPVKEKPLVLFIDDEAKVLQVAKKMLEHANYDLMTFNNAEEALAIVEKRAVAVVISDNRMPKMKGLDFFEKIKVISPMTVRILTTAYYDESLVDEIVNKGEVFRFLKKPLDFGLAKSTIMLGMEHYKKSIADAEKSTLFEKLLHKVTQFRQKCETLSAEVGHLKKMVRGLIALIMVLVLSFSGYNIYRLVSERTQSVGSGHSVGHWIKYPASVALDTKHDLMWMTKDFRAVEQRQPQNWTEAQEWAGKMNEKKIGGYSDWRVPSIAEYQNSYDPERIRLAFDRNNDFPVGYPRVFEDGGGYGFWSKEEIGEEDSAKFFFFAGGYEKSEKKNYNNPTMSVRLVRNP